MNRKIVLATAAFLCYMALLLGVYAAMPLIITGTGTIAKIDLASDDTRIEWDLVYLNTPVIRQREIINTGTVPVSSLTMTHTAMGLTESDYTLTWDYDGESILPGRSIDVIFTLTVTGYTDTAFTTEITIEGTP